MKKVEKALVVLSGGQDSTTCLFWAIHKFGVENVYAISFDYGQRHAIELDSAMVVADMAGLANYKGTVLPEFGPHSYINVSNGRHEILCVKNLLQSTSPLTSDNDLDKYSDFDSMAEEVGNKVEKTFVPMRNTLFLTIAANRAVAIGARHIVTGICQADNANYPDCTNAFRNRIRDAFNESLFGMVSKFNQELIIDAPLMYMSKAESVKLAMTLPGCMDALAYSHTSYDGKYPPTDMNHSNILRAKGFEEAGVPDPLVLRAWREGEMALPETANYTDWKYGLK